MVRLMDVSIGSRGAYLEVPVGARADVAGLAVKEDFP
jgi:hypothetical protein